MTALLSVFLGFSVLANVLVSWGLLAQMKDLRQFRDYWHRMYLRSEGENKRILQAMERGE